eukprot:TRINITY_DN10949_c0_g2_i1.p1 TRINITY_DN10949_c0_g2~~TRINITY_DN10949_c0_g2_i1.p1  ORF type:complete len:308 (+),score=34.97 TRINITY_DN10949_c0_g2_i1:50-973(+)
MSETKNSVFSNLPAIQINSSPLKRSLSFSSFDDVTYMNFTTKRSEIGPVQEVLKEKQKTRSRSHAVKRTTTPSSANNNENDNKTKTSPKEPRMETPKTPKKINTETKAIWKPAYRRDLSNEKKKFQQKFAKRLFMKIESGKVGIHTLLKVGQTIWGGFIDGTLAVWDIRTGLEIGRRQAHKGRIFSMLLVGDKVWTGSDDNKFRIWTLFVTLYKEVPNIFRASCLMEYMNDIWCGYLDGCIRITDSKCFKMKKELTIGFSVRHLSKHKNQVWICTDDNVIRLNAQVSFYDFPYTSCLLYTSPSPRDS